MNAELAERILENKDIADEVLLKEAWDFTLAQRAKEAEKEGFIGPKETFEFIKNKIGFHCDELKDLINHLEFKEKEKDEN